MTDYKQKYLKYKQKYLSFKMTQKGGAKTKLTKENITIEKQQFINENNNKIKDKDIIDLINKAYGTNITEFIPHTDINGTAIIWKILYEKKLVGLCVTTDLDQFKKYGNFESKGGIIEGKGLYITSVAGNSEYSGIVNLLFDTTYCRINRK